MRRDRGRSNLTWEEFVKRDLKDWCITKELALDRREWKLTIHVSEPWSSVPSFNCFFVKFFFRSFSLFWLTVLLHFLLFSIWFFIALCFPPSFSLLFCPYFLAHVVSSLAYPNLLGNKMLDCCCIVFKVVRRRKAPDPLLSFTCWGCEPKAPRGFLNLASPHA
jgi:hypothetical protein